MRRRELLLLVGGAVTAPHALRAQQKAMPVIGHLSYFGSRTTPPAMAAFHAGLGEVGYVEGQNVVIEYRDAEGHANRLSALAADLVAGHVNVIVAVGGNPAALAAKKETSDI